MFFFAQAFPRECNGENSYITNILFCKMQYSLNVGIRDLNAKSVLCVTCREINFELLKRQVSKINAAFIVICPVKEIRNMLLLRYF